MPTLIEAWDQFKAERSIALCPTSLTADYKQVGKWLARCPIRKHYVNVTQEYEMPVL